MIYVHKSLAGKLDTLPWSVSESHVPRVYEYILNQKEHHFQQDFLLEYNNLIELHGLKKEDANE